MTREARFTYTDADMIAMQRAWWMGAARWQRLCRTFLILTAVYSAIVVGINLASGSPAGSGVPVAIAISAVVTIVIYGLGFVLAPLLGRRALRQNKLLGGEHHWHWDDDALTIDHERGHYRIPYELLHAWLDSPRVLLLYQSPRLVHALPRRALGEGDAATLIASLRRAGVLERRRFGFITAKTG